MKRPAHTAGFTLVEMLMVMVIIAILAALIVQVSGLVSRKAAASRAGAEIKAMGTACEAYNSDNGSYPRSAQYTESATAGSAPIDPRTNGNPQASNYYAASLFLYEQLSGDADHNGVAGDNNAKVYFPFSRSMMGGASSGAAGKKVQYIQDPFGFSYGYSTAGAKDEEDYRAAAATSTAAKRSNTHGFNTTFDLWSTGGTTVASPTDATRQRWIKNW